MKKERGFSLIEKFRRFGKTQNSKMFTYNLHTKAVKSKNIYRLPRITYIADKSFFHSFHCRVGKSEAQNSTPPVFFFIKNIRNPKSKILFFPCPGPRHYHHRSINRIYRLFLLFIKLFVFCFKIFIIYISHVLKHFLISRRKIQL